MSLFERIKSFSSHLAGSPDSGPVYRLVVEITNACNLKCTMCPRGSMTRKVGHMDPALFASVIEENRNRLEFVSLNGYGEPLLSPHVHRYLKMCRDSGVPSGMSTNCTLLGRENARMLLDNPPDLLILALDAVNQESYERVRVGASFQEVMGNVRDFLDLSRRSRRRPFLVIQSICMSETIDQIGDFRDFFRAYPFVSIRIRQLTYSGLGRKDRDYRNRRRSCYWLWTEPMILWDGTMVPCCQDVNGSLALGSLKEGSVNTLWRRGRIEDLRVAHGSGRRDGIAICRMCNMVQPGGFLAGGAALLDTMRTNRFLPGIETLISRIRYGT